MGIPSLNSAILYIVSLYFHYKDPSLPLRMTAGWRGVEGAVPYGVYEYNIVCRRGGFHIRPFGVSGAYGMLPYGV